MHSVRTKCILRFSVRLFGKLTQSKGEGQNHGIENEKDGEQEEDGWIEWYPIADEGNAQVEGKWTVEKLDDGNTRLVLTTKGEFELPLPSLAKVVVKPLVAREFDGLVDKYIKNLQKLWTS